MVNALERVVTNLSTINKDQFYRITLRACKRNNIISAVQTGTATMGR